MGQSAQENLLEKRKGQEDINYGSGMMSGPTAKRGFFEHQSSFATFMIKKGDIISRLKEEKGVDEETCEENINFKSEEWVAMRDKGKRGGAASKYTKNLKQILANDPNSDKLGSYTSIDGGISVKRPAKYCDFTGFTTKYQDPKTALRYFNSDFYPYVKTLPDSVKDEYLAIRKANVILK